MIQRVQSLYLLAASVLLCFLFFNPIAQIEIEGNIFLMLYHGRIQDVDPQSPFNSISIWPLTVLVFFATGLNLFTIFSYKKRLRQIRLCIFNIILHFGLVGMIYFYTKYTLHQHNGVQSVFLWPVVIPLISMVLIYLALKAVQRDELLVNSVNRFRR